MMRPRLLTPLLAALVAVPLLLAGACSAGDDTADAEASAGAPAFEETAAAQAADEAGVAESGPAAAPAADDGGAAADDGGGDTAADASGGIAPGPGGRRVVVASLVVSTDDVARAADRARSLAAGSGGFVAAESVTGGDEPEATLTLRVPVDSADTFLTALGDLGDEITREVGAEDVEGRLVDLESRTASAKASIERVRALLAGATDLKDVVLLEGELSRREADYESLEAQRAALADQAQLATITVRFVLPDAAPEVAEPRRGFLAGLEAGWSAFEEAAVVALTVVGAVLPFLVLPAAVVALVLWLGRSRRRRRSAVPTIPAS